MPVVGAAPREGCGVTTTRGGTAVLAGIGTFTGNGGKMLFSFSIAGTLCKGWSFVIGILMVSEPHVGPRFLSG